MRKESPIATDQPEAALDTVRSAVQKSPLAIGLLHLPPRRFLELSDPAKRLLGLDGIDLKHLDVLTRIVVSARADLDLHAAQVFGGSDDQGAHALANVKNHARLAAQIGGRFSHRDPTSADVIALLRKV